MVLSIRNERGEETTRQVIGVGALYPTSCAPSRCRWK
jgi:hypothetical protein